jgi:hypothetical protein
MAPADLDWQQPWYAAWSDPARCAADRLAQGLPLHDALNADGRAAVRFVPQEALPAGEPYEAFVLRTGSCPVRPGLHDFFNGLCWMAFPRTKARFNALQAAAIARDGVGARRGPLRDAITVFDENGALLNAPALLWEALLARDWRRAFVELRPLWAQASCVVFGHALLEKLAQPRKDLTAHVWAADCPLDDAWHADHWLAAQCTESMLASKPFTPLPVLGVPHWWPENTNFSFYDDSHVFRPRRTAPGPSRP